MLAIFTAFYWGTITNRTDIVVLRIRSKLDLSRIRSKLDLSTGLRVCNVKGHITISLTKDLMLVWSPTHIPITHTSKGGIEGWRR